MTALIIDVLGWIGAAGILTAYALVSSQRVHGASVSYQGLNIVGSLLLIINTGYYGAYPSLGVNVVWIGIGLYALISSRHHAYDPPHEAGPGP